MDAEAILHGLNEAQRNSVTSPASVLQVLAPPGSGKTKTLTARVAYLIAHHQLRPWNIIVCTFTRKAANEMKERIRNFIGDELARQIRLGTFHSIAAQYLRQYGQHIGLAKSFGIADTTDSKAILKRIIKKNDFTIQPGQALGRISAQKVKGLSAEEIAKTAKHVEQQEFAQVFAQYERELEASNLLDYDDLLLRCCFLMKTHPACVANVDAVLIDEFQDTNTVQYDLMELFAQRRNAITIVGDPDQSIYGFRSAEIKNLGRMKSRWSDTLTINLEENYRSSGSILNAAQNIIEQDESRPPKRLQATHSPGQRPVLRKLPTAHAEATWLVAEIKRMYHLSGGTLKHDDFAILLRAAALSRMIESALSKEGLPYRMVGGTKFYDRVEVKLTLDYLRVIHQPSNSEAVERIINVPSRRIGDATVKSLREEASSKQTTIWKLAQQAARGQRISTKLTAAAEKGISNFVNVILSGQRKMPGSTPEQGSILDLMNLVINKIDLQAYLKQKFESEHEARWSNVEELLAQAAEMSDPDKLRAMAEEQALPEVEGLEQRTDASLDALGVFLANVALTASIEDRGANGKEPIPQVTISTIHSAKGLEWPVVFIPACYEGSIPHSRAEDNDEERRLLYVGMTRAQTMLYLSCPIKNTQREDTTMSSFLTQSGVSSYFEEHGPSMSFESACGLAVTLRREQPSTEDFNNAKVSLESDEDNYWPLNGEEPPEERAKWDYGRSECALPVFGNARTAILLTTTTTTMEQQQGFQAASGAFNQGFVSVKDRYEDLEAQGRLKSIDKRAESRRDKSDANVPKGRKRQIEGQGTLTGFFSSKRQHISTDTSSSSDSTYKIRNLATQAPGPLRDISNINLHSSSTTSSKQSRPSPTIKPAHKLRTAPLSQPPSSAPPPDKYNPYVFLSSSPPPESEDEATEEHQSKEDTVETQTQACTPGLTNVVRPASTFHTTSMHTVNAHAPKRRTLGVKPSFNGWANRARK